MDLHRLAEERSIAYHRAVAERLRCDSSVLSAVRARLLRFIDQDRSAHHARAWLAILDEPLDDLLRFMVDPGERARELRQSTPFVGLVDPRERFRIWREVRALFERDDHR